MLKNQYTCKSNVSNFICSIYGSIAINEDRNLISFGTNSKGVLGHEEIDDTNLPKQIDVYDILFVTTIDFIFLPSYWFRSTTH